ncbi:MAG: 5'/3'-nucleotidase SurE [Legionellales bacterium]|nr:5'/3'-nucleotidase SurE [Legionellales bacterium]
MNILVSNDDGVHARGIQLLAQTLGRLAKVQVVAPDRDRSGASNSLTLSSPLRCTELENGFLCVEGTPTDCVHLAVTGLLDFAADMVISGINAGANLGDDTLYSGTVAAAMEGRNLGLPALAISLCGEHPQHYATAAQIATLLVTQLRYDPLPAKTILNVNVPDKPLAQLAGIAVTRLGARHVAEPVVQQTDPRGRPIYWIGPAGAELDCGPGTDFHAVNQGYVSVTPLQIDLTHYQVFDQLSGWVKQLTL